MATTTSVDGVEVLSYDEGTGPPIVMLGPGLDDGRRTKRIAHHLSSRHRVVRLHRRQYRMDLRSVPGLDFPCSIADEVADLLAVIRSIGEPVVVYGHSDGAVVALEALAGVPSVFHGAVIFEPPIVIDKPLAGDHGEGLSKAREALAADRPGAALETFLRVAVELPAWQARLSGWLAAVVPKYRRLIPGQIDAMEAIDRLGVRLDAYAQIAVPVILLGGDRSPAHLAERLTVLARVIPHAEHLVLPGYDHAADVKHPRRIADIVHTFADRATKSRPDPG